MASKLSPSAGVPAAAAAQNATILIAGHPLSRFYLRFHVGLILLFSFSAGVLANKALLVIGVHPMLWRYPVAMLVSYGAFFAGIRVWLAYVGAEPFKPDLSGFTGNGSGGNSGSFNIGSWGGGSRSLPPIRGGGGDFSGGGASGSFGDASGSADLSSGSGLDEIAGGSPKGGGSWFSFGSHGSGGGGKGGGLSLDLGDGDDWLIILLLILVAALLFSVFGAAIYLLHAAPAMLSDVAFQAMLAGGLVKSSQKWRDASWEMSLLHKTWIPFTLIFILAVATAALAGHLFPGVNTLHEVLQIAWSRVG